MASYTDQDGVTRELEAWEVEALEAAREAHYAAQGVTLQYSQAKADRIIRELVADALVPDGEAVRMLSCFPAWQAGTEYRQGQRVRHADALWTVLQTHTSQADWAPDVAVSLFARVLPGQGGTEAGEWVQPDSTNPYGKGDRVTWQGKTYESTIDNNVWSPTDYPQGWREVAE